MATQSGGIFELTIIYEPEHEARVLGLRNLALAEDRTSSCVSRQSVTVRLRSCRVKLLKTTAYRASSTQSEASDLADKKTGQRWALWQVLGLARRPNGMRANVLARNSGLAKNDADSGGQEVVGRCGAGLARRARTARRR